MSEKGEDRRPESIPWQKGRDLQNDAFSPSQRLPELIDNKQDVRQIALGSIHYAWWLRR
jgi:hypothetical protein